MPSSTSRTSSAAEAAALQTADMNRRNTQRDSGKFVDGDSADASAADMSLSGVTKAKREKIEAKKEAKKEKIEAQREQRAENGGAEDDEHADLSQASNPAKRRRTLNGHANGHAADREQLERENEDEEYEEPEAAEDDDNDAAEAEIEVERAVATRDRKDDFVPGSIVRVELHNFVTYDHVVFHPGPYLNMIIGPNGTGKSTIACAIALGLGYKPALLGRANDVASFVKQTKESGWIEIELKGSEGEKNLVVRRHLKEKQNTSDYMLNGKKATAKEVTEAVREYQVQIDNLCSFLPQDKVTEFARMTPKELLIETMKAAADGAALLKHYTRLVEYSKMLRVVNSELRTHREECEQLKNQNQRLQRDADRHAERQNMAERLDVLDVALAFVDLAKSHQHFAKLKAEKAKIKQRIADFQKKMSPITDALELVEEKLTKIKTNTKVQQAHQAKTQDIIKKSIKTIKQLEVRKEKAESELSSLAHAERNRAKQIETLKAAVAELQERVGEAPPDVDTREIDQRNGEIRREQADLARKVQDMNEESHRVQRESKKNKENIERTAARLERLKNVKDVRYMELQRGDPGCAKAVDWLRQNTHLFKGKVWEPAVLEIEILPEHKHLTNAVESLLSWKQLKTFVCELRCDYDLFNRKVNDELKFRVNVVDVERIHESQQLLHSVSRADLRYMGFVDYAINLIRGPDAIRDFLCWKVSFGKIPIAASERNIDVLAVERSGQFQRFIAGDMSYSLAFNKYANGAVSSSTSFVKPARNLTTSIDRGALDELDREMRRLHEESNDFQNQMAKIETARQKAQVTTQNLKQERDELVARKTEMEAVLRDYQRALVELSAKKDQLKKILSQSNPDNKRREIKKNLCDIASNMALSAQELKTARIAELQQLHEINKLRLASIQAAANQAAIKDIKELANGESEQLAEEAMLVAENIKKTKKRILRLHDEAQERSAQAPEHVNEKLQIMQREGLPSRNEMMTEQAELRAQLDGAPQISDDIVRRYQEKKAKIEELERVIEDKQTTQTELDGKVNKYRGKWEPPLRRLINKVNEKYSEAFKRFNCGGEVSLSKGSATGEDAELAFEEWCVEIRVKFREREELQLLTSERQSGGERSLSTILYLMSLTELGSSPFSLVDEINQGMDQRAERLVHDQMVLTTCRPQASQYFLITPKLLTGLKYHPLMRVLIINNGDYLPQKFDFGNYIQPSASATVAARA